MNGISMAFGQTFHSFSLSGLKKKHQGSLLKSCLLHSFRCTSGHWVSFQSTFVSPWPRSSFSVNVFSDYQTAPLPPFALDHFSLSQWQKCAEDTCCAWQHWGTWCSTIDTYIHKCSIHIYVWWFFALFAWLLFACMTCIVVQCLA